MRFSAGADIVWKTDHVITFADAGVDLPTCGAGVTTHCETDANDVVNPGTAEVNPLHVTGSTWSATATIPRTTSAS